MDSSGVMLVISVVLFSFLLGALVMRGPVEQRAMDTVHATLEARCVEGEQYSRDLLECVIPRHGR